MQALTATFLAGVSAETLIRWWLASRQIAAVTAHRNQVPEPFRGSVDIASQRKAADYTVARVRFGRWAIGFEAVLKVAFTLGGGLALVDAALSRVTLPEPWHGALVVLCVLLIMQLLGQPFALWRTFVLEARFGFNRVTPRLYAVDFAKRMVLGLGLYGPLLLVLLLLCERAGSTWWIWAAIATSLGAVAITWAAPRFIAPLFNQFSPLTDTNLRQRVQGLLDRCGFAARGLFVMDGSRRSSHGNAYFTGIGRNKVVVLFDTLLARIDGDEIEAVLAHELGHFRLHHVGQRLWLSVLGIVVSFALLGWVLHEPWVYQALGVPAPSAPMAFLLFMIVTPVLSFFATPLRSWWWRRQEWEADEYATRHASPAKLASALIKLYRDNASTLTPDPLYSGFYDSHPPALARIARLNAGP